MTCNNVISLQDMENDKKHSIFYREVITGKSYTTGADIDSATNQVTMQTQQTMPSVIKSIELDGALAVSSLGFKIVGDFSDPQKAVVNLANEVYTSKALAGLEGYLWRPVVSLPYTPAGSNPNLPPELGNWVAVAVGDLKTISLSLNADDSGFIYSTDNITTLDNVKVIYDLTSQTSYYLPPIGVSGERIVSLTGDMLRTTNFGPYKIAKVETRNTIKTVCIDDYEHLVTKLDPSNPRTWDWSTAYEAARDSINAFAWKGSVPLTGQAPENNYSGTIKFGARQYRFIRKVYTNPYVAHEGIPRGIEFRQNFNVYSEGESLIWCDFTDLAGYAFDSAPYNISGVREFGLNRRSGIGVGSTSTKMGGIVFRHLTIVSNHDKNAVYGAIRFADAPGYELDHCIIEGFMTGYMETACWTNKRTNNLILAKGVGVASVGVVNNTYSAANYINNWRNNEAVTAVNCPYFVAENATTNPASTRFYNTGLYMTGTAIVGSHNDVIERWDRVCRVDDFSQLILNTTFIEDIKQFAFEGNLSKIIVDNPHFYTPSLTLFVMRGDGEYVLNKPDGNYGLLYQSAGTPTDSQLEVFGVYPKNGDNYERLTTKFGREEQRQLYIDEYEKLPTKRIYVAASGGQDINSGMLGGTVAPLATLAEALKRLDKAGSYQILLQRGGTYSADAFSTIPDQTTLTIGVWGTGAKPIVNWYTVDRVSNLKLNAGSRLRLQSCEFRTVQASGFLADSRVWFDANGYAMVDIDDCVLRVGGSQGLFGNSSKARGEFAISITNSSIGGSLDLSFGALSRSVGVNSAYVEVVAFDTNTTVDPGIGTWGATTHVKYSDFN